MARGGFRVGAGRKPKETVTAVLHGTRQRKGVVRFPVTPAPAETPTPRPVAVRAPKGLTGKPLRTWKDLAPHAQGRGTLTADTAAAFALLCRAIVLEKQLAEIEAGSPNHRGMIQRVMDGLTRFGLAPIGKPIAAPLEKQADPFAEFDSAAS